MAPGDIGLPSAAVQGFRHGRKMIGVCLPENILQCIGGGLGRDHWWVGIAAGPQEERQGGPGRGGWQSRKGDHSSAQEPQAQATSPGVPAKPRSEEATGSARVSPSSRLFPKPSTFLYTRAEKARTCPQTLCRLGVGRGPRDAESSGGRRLTQKPQFCKSSGIIQWVLKAGTHWH